MRKNFFSDFSCTHWRTCAYGRYAPGLICTCTTSKRNKFAYKRTLDFPNKYPEYANDWLVSRIAVRAETVNVSVHRVGLLDRLLQKVAVML